MCTIMLPQKQFALLYSDDAGNQVFALSAESTSIGRSPDQDLVLEEGIVSRRHALIRRVNDDFELVDQKSSHGTFLNGERIEHALLKVGDVVQFGSLNSRQIRFCDLGTGAKVSDSSLAMSLLSAMSSLAPKNQQPVPAMEMGQLAFLINAARQLNSGEAIGDILQVLLQLTLRLTGVERGFVFLSEGGNLRLAQGMGSDGRVVLEDSTISRRAIQKAVDHSSKFYISDTLRDENAAQWDSVVANSIRSIYCIPLRKRVSPSEPNRLLGLLYLDSQLNAGTLNEIDHEVLDTLASEASTLLHNALLAAAEQEARLAAEELAIAARIHSGLMSMTLPALPYARLQAKTIPCHAIGGDFFDVIALDDCVCVVVADVSGKGVPASIVAATLQKIIHAQMLTHQSLPQIADLLNQFLCTRKVGKYATMVLLKMCPDGSVEYINCGHIPPSVIGPAGSRQLEENNLIVGLIPGAQYTSARCTLAPGERILLTTDGITEAENAAGEQFGEAGFDSALHFTNIDAIFDQAAMFQAPNEAQDDWTLLDIEYRGDGTIASTVV
jgi:sigma-B regulation protein RsbU (phosphoserine phosphatase)